MHIISRLGPDQKGEEVPRCWGSPLSGAACRGTALCSAEWRRLNEQLRWLRNTTLDPESGMLTESDSPRFCNLTPASAGSRSYGFTVEGRSLCQREFKSISSSGIRTARDLKLLRQYFKVILCMLVSMPGQSTKVSSLPSDAQLGVTTI